MTIADTTATALLEARSLTVGHGAVPVVHDVNLTVGAGEVVALLGVNGAGKTTTVRALAGDLKPMSGEVRLHGQRVTGPLHQRAKHGLRYISEERSVFMGLSTADNLRLGGAVLLVEQNVRDALEVADRAYVLSHGQIVLEGDARDLRGRIDEIERTYLAGSELVTAR